MWGEFSIQAIEEIISEEVFQSTLIIDKEEGINFYVPRTMDKQTMKQIIEVQK